MAGMQTPARRIEEGVAGMSQDHTGHKQGCGTQSTEKDSVGFHGKEMEGRGFAGPEARLFHTVRCWRTTVSVSSAMGPFATTTPRSMM